MPARPRRIWNRLQEEISTWKPTHAVLGFVLASLLGAAWTSVKGATLLGQWIFLVALQVCFLAVSEWIRRNISAETANEKRVAAAQEALMNLSIAIPPVAPPIVRQAISPLLSAYGLDQEAWKDILLARLCAILAPRLIQQVELYLQEEGTNEIARSYLDSIVGTLSLDDLRSATAPAQNTP